MHADGPDRIAEEAAFEATVAPLWEPLVRFARHLAGCPHAGDDLAQEALIVLHRRRAEVEPGKEAAFLFGCCRNLQRNRAREGYRRGTLPLDPERDAAPRADPAPAACARHDLDRALAGLAAEDRELLLMRSLGGLTVPEIARETGMKEGTVKSRLHYAALAMRRKLGGYPS